MSPRTPRSTLFPTRRSSDLSACVDVLENEPQHHKKLWENTKFFKAGLKALGFNTGNSVSPVTPIIVGNGAKAAKFSDDLLKADRKSTRLNSSHSQISYAVFC